MQGYSLWLRDIRNRCSEELMIANNSSELNKINNFTLLINYHIFIQNSAIHTQEKETENKKMRMNIFYAHKKAMYL